MRFERSSEDAVTTEAVMKVVEYLLEKDIPHNVMMNSKFVYLTPRKPQKVSMFSYSTPNGGLHIAVAEVSGYVICFDECTYAKMTELDLQQLCKNEVSLDAATLQSIVNLESC